MAGDPDPADDLCFRLESLRGLLPDLRGLAAGLSLEMRKIDGSGEILPITAAVLRDLLCIVKQRMEGMQVDRVKREVLELFPTKCESEEEKERGKDEKRSTEEEMEEDRKLWSNDIGLSCPGHDSKTSHFVHQIGKGKGNESSTTSDESKNEYSGGGFSHLAAIRRVPTPIPYPLLYSLPDFCSITPATADTSGAPGFVDLNEPNLSSRFFAPSSTSMLEHNPLPPPRKQRRCWSIELHRKFERALQVLGGPEVATPKQIREVMKVDGLTNDEVKSHLQKFRIHAKKSSLSTDAQLKLAIETSQHDSPNGPLDSPIIPWQDS